MDYHFHFVIHRLNNYFMFFLVPSNTFSFLRYTSLLQGQLILLPHQGPLPPPVAQCRCTPSGESQTCSLASGVAAHPFTVKALYLCL